jgi:hypothetical protein
LGVSAAIAGFAPVGIAEGGKTSWEITFSSSGAGGAKFRSGGNESNVEMWDIGGGGVVSVQAKDGILLRFGGDFRRFNYNVPVSIAFPSQLQSFNLVAGADFQIGEALLARVDILPGFYGGSGSLRSRDLNVPINLGAFYFLSTDVQLMLGMRIDAQWNFPVIPVAGIRWRINDEWVLNALLPTPRIEYSVNKALTLFAGARLDGATYRMPADFGTSRGDARLNNAWGNYALVRVGAGAVWKMGDSVTFEVEGGFVPFNVLDFPRADSATRSTSVAAYGGVSLRGAY